MPLKIDFGHGVDLLQRQPATRIDGSLEPAAAYYPYLVKDPPPLVVGLGWIGVLAELLVLLLLVLNILSQERQAAIPHTAF